MGSDYRDPQSIYILDNLQIAWVRSFGYDRDWAQKHFFKIGFIATLTLNTKVVKSLRPMQESSAEAPQAPRLGGTMTLQEPEYHRFLLPVIRQLSHLPLC